MCVCAQGYVEVRYDEEKKRVVQEPLQLSQAFRECGFFFVHCYGSRLNFLQLVRRIVALGADWSWRRCPASCLRASAQTRGTKGGSKEMKSSACLSLKCTCPGSVGFFPIVSTELVCCILAIRPSWCDLEACCSLALKDLASEIYTPTFSRSTSLTSGWNLCLQ